MRNSVMTDMAHCPSAGPPTDLSWCTPVNSRATAPAPPFDPSPSAARRASVDPTRSTLTSKQRAAGCSSATTVWRAVSPLQACTAACLSLRQRPIRPQMSHCVYGPLTRYIDQQRHSQRSPPQHPLHPPQYHIQRPRPILLCCPLCC